MRDFIIEQLKNDGLVAEFQQFEASTPNPDALNTDLPVSLEILKVGYNIIAHFPALREGKTCTTLYGSHYDTKPLDGFEYLGANDSASSSIVLMMLATYMSQNIEEFKTALKCDITFVWFDGEEAQLHNWTDGEFIHPIKQQDNTYGSRHFVAQLKDCGSGKKCLPENDLEVDSLILLDMVGEDNLMFSRDSYSTQELVSVLSNVLEKLDEPSRLARNSKAIEDDHIPFIQAGIPAVNLIDFENTGNWHKHTDLPENIRPESLELAGRTALGVLLQK